MEISWTLVHIRNSIRKVWAHSSVWIEWLPAEQLVEGSNPSGPALKVMLLYRRWITICVGISTCRIDTL